MTQIHGLFAMGRGQAGLLFVFVIIRARLILRREPSNP
jgi:hypothetical protein